RGMVVFTAGLLRHMKPDELLAVAGHELRHLRTRDSLPALLGGSWLMVLGELSFWLRGVGRSLAEGGSFVGIFAVVFQLCALVLDAALWLAGWAASAVLATRSRYNEH
ncbi:MAG TPA: M48 family metalloprotease, partial [Symbiobacteriaceae bacterium]|nr:M48 family metalloprotease [Symbiobacteriaceae bacterium]